MITKIDRTAFIHYRLYYNNTKKIVVVEYMIAVDDTEEKGMDSETTAADINRQVSAAHIMCFTEMLGEYFQAKNEEWHQIQHQGTIPEIWGPEEWLMINDCYPALGNTFPNMTGYCNSDMRVQQMVNRAVLYEIAEISSGIIEASEHSKRERKKLWRHASHNREQANFCMQCWDDGAVEYYRWADSPQDD